MHNRSENWILCVIDVLNGCLELDTPVVLPLFRKFITVVYMLLKYKMQILIPPCYIFHVIFLSNSLKTYTTKPFGLFWYLFIVCFLLGLCAMFVLGASARVHKVTATSQALTHYDLKGLCETKAQL